MNSSFRGKLIQGDNAAVLDSLRREGTQVTCAYIDPPYNNHDRLQHYDDSVSDNIWLDQISSCALQIKQVLAENGSLWVSIDDGMMHYLKVRLDEIFGRENFVSTIVWEHRTSRENRAVFSNNHEYILVYARDRKKFKEYRNPLEFTAEWKSRFKNPDNDPKGDWQSVSATAQGGHATKSQIYAIECPDGRMLYPPKGRCWTLTKERMLKAIGEGRIYFGRGGGGVPRIKKYLSEVEGGLTPHTLWKAEEAGTTAHAKKHVLSISEEMAVFETPKPEELIARIVHIATKPNDLVLDAYLGSGTTAAVAHKLGRRYIGIEIGDHIATHCVARLRSVCRGEEGGISTSTGWRGGGDFEFSRHA
ncbi:MAG: site-specific DNA-methyltransferase [Rhizobiaceae bacterium]|nr:site-specific DNA-methyltransferase [Rhizobiaceae bacterium]